LVMLIFRWLWRCCEAITKKRSPSSSNRRPTKHDVQLILHRSCIYTHFILQGMQLFMCILRLFPNCVDIYYRTVLFAPTQVEIEKRKKKRSTKRNMLCLLSLWNKKRFIHLHGFFLKYIVLNSMTSNTLKQK